MFVLSKIQFGRADYQLSKSRYSCQKQYKIGDWVLAIYKNESLSKSIQTHATGEVNGICIGTPLYKSFPFHEVLKRVSDDFFLNKLDTEALQGNFVFIFWKNDELYFLMDKLGVQPLYFDEVNGRFSSSFLYLLQTGGRKYKMNRSAFLEKLATGFILGEDTLVSGIRKILPTTGLHDILNSSLHWVSHSYSDINDLQFHSDGRQKSIGRQIEKFSSYFQKVNSSFQQSIGDLGLSGGFDCRLILALAEKYLDTKLHLHSHNTVGVHDSQLIHAKELALVYESELQLIPTKRIESLPDDQIDNVLFKNLVFFDGNSARHLGAFSETYTYDYKKASMGNAFYSLNGLGGEILRDSYFSGSKKMKWNEWVNRYVFMPFSIEATGSKQNLQIVSDYVRSKLERQLPLNWDKMDIFSTHAYYGLIKMPQCNGAVAAAYNKVSPFLFPFIEYNNVIEALKAVPYLGVGGTYQAALINKICPQLAKVSSTYGSGFDNLSIKYLIWSKLKTIGSAEKRNRIVRDQLLKKAHTGHHKLNLENLYKSDTLKQAKEALLDFSTDTEFDLMLVESTQKRYAIFLGFMLMKLSDYIEK